MLIRRKITLALVVTNLAVIATVATVAYASLYFKFNDRIAATALSNFRDDAIRYIETYGSWEAGVASESFDVFVARRSRQTNRPLVLGLGQAVAPTSTPAALGLGRPPFHFMVFSPQGKVLKAIPPYQIGATIRAADRANAQPLEIGGNVVAYVVARGDIAYSPLDLGYLAAIRQATWLGVAAGLTLALIVGWWLGARFALGLNALTGAVQSVQNGEFGRQVAVESDDEIGALARAFNLMSDELRRSREALAVSQRQIEMLRELADRDALTQLHNRRFFDEHVVKLDRDFETTVVLGDIDHFKRINDRCSHATGDAVLRQVGEILRESTRRTDIVARYGGEEFVIAFNDVPSERAYALCEKLRLAIANHPWHQIHPGLQVTMSFGLASMHSSSAFEDVLKVADRMLYQAKAEGRNRICVAPKECV